MNFRSLRLVVIVLILIVASAWVGWSFYQSSVAATGSSNDSVQQASELPKVIVHKSPTCGCCGKWEDHLRAHGFKVESRPTDQMAAIKSEHGIPSDLQSCHTAEVGEYIVEGHVPAEAILSLLQSGQKVAGLAVPGMPVGSPGMEGSYTESYDVIAYDKEGHREVFLKK